MCSASFGQKTHLNTHVKNVHKISLPFKCVECAAAFGSVHELKVRNPTSMDMNGHDVPIACGPGLDLLRFEEFPMLMGSYDTAAT